MYENDPEFREKQKAKTADLSGVEYSLKLLKNRRRSALIRMAERANP